MFLNPRGPALSVRENREVPSKGPSSHIPERPAPATRAAASIVPARPAAFPRGTSPSAPARPETPPRDRIRSVPTQPQDQSSAPAPSVPVPPEDPSREPSPSIPAGPEVPAVSRVVPTSLARLGFEPHWAFVWRRKAYIFASVVAALFLCLVVELAVGPRYRAASQILIGPVDLRVLDKSVMPPAQTADANVIQVESETRILTSDKVLRRVVESERLAADAEFQTGGGSSMLGAAISALRVAIGLKSDPARTIDPEFAALRQLQRNVYAKRTERTYVVDLIVETNDPEKSARIANAIALAYLDEQSDARAEAARRATDSLSSRLSEQRERVRQAEEQVERYKAERNIVGPTGRLVDEQQLTELNNQLSTARARASEAKARYEQMQQLQRSGADQGSTTEAVQSNTIGRLREQYAAIARQEANLSAELGPRHPWVIEAHAQARNAQRQITDEIGRIADATRTDYERALANETSLMRSLDALKQRAKDTSLAFVRLRELEREVDASRAVYESFLVRARETREQERLDTANVRILSDAQPPQDRSWPPRRLLMLLAALALGLLGGVGLAYVVELYSRNSQQAEQTTRPKEQLA